MKTKSYIALGWRAPTDHQIVGWVPVSDLQTLGMLAYDMYVGGWGWADMWSLLTAWGAVVNRRIASAEVCEYKTGRPLAVLQRVVSPLPNEN